MGKERGSVRVVVVGAGMSGLSTARHLLQAGFANVTLLEASDRLGGRIKSVKVSEGVVVEMGATCIHGASMDNPVYRLSNEWGLEPSLVTLDRIDGQYYQENGETIDNSLVEQVWNLYMDMETEMCTMAESGRLAEGLKNRTTIQEYVDKAKPRILQQFPEGKTRDAASNAFNTMLNYLQFMNGDALEKSSADLFGQYKTLPGHEMMFTGKGYSGFVEKVRGNIPDEAIQYNAEVSKICWGGDEVEILCKDGRKYSADHVVVTCSLGHLKANHQRMFEPPLPNSKAGAIQRRGFGRVTKLFLYYDQPVRQQGVKLAWSSHGDPITHPSQWVRSFTWLDMQPTNSKTIGGPFAGEGAAILETLTEEEVSAQCTQVLRQFLQDPTFPEPSKVLRSAWNSDPLFRGGYSYASNDSREDDVRHLAGPLPCQGRPRLLFAGEATHPDYFSTVHGAFLTGVRESQRLADYYTNSKL
ncbi:hypothetical protein ACOMHN_002075 [Nucella lapillus]